MERSAIRRTQAYHPVNTAILRAFQDLPDDNFHLDGEPVEIIELVAKVEDLSESGMRMEFRFSDELGEFVGVVFRKQGALPPALMGYDVGRRGYAHIVGTVKRFYNTLTIVVARLAPVYDYAAVLNHRLLVIWASGVRRGKITQVVKAAQENAPQGKSGPQANILQALRKSQNILTDSNKVPLARQLGMQISELERHLNGMAQMGYLYKDEITGRYVVMDGN